MVAIKAGQAASFLKTLDPRIRAVLLFGSDAGLVSERGAEISKRMAAREKPAGEVLRLEDADLEDDSGRIAVEVQTVPMFGGAKIVRAGAGRRINAQALEPLVKAERLEGGLVVEAGNLKPDDALRKLFEGAPNAAAIACYADEGQDLARIVDDVLGAAKLTIASDAKAELVSRLGADRGLSRAEIEKLALYAQGKGTVSLDDVEAVVGDAAELALDRVILAAAAGDSRAALTECDRAVSSGESAQSIILAAQRHFLRLQRLRALMDKGQPAEAAMRQMRPPVNFKQARVIEASLKAWQAQRLELALTRISRAAIQARLNSSLEAVLAERLLLELARLVRPAAR